MLALDALRARLLAKVPALAGNIENAAQFALLVQRMQLPQWRVGAFLLPGRLTGGRAEAMTGQFVQTVQDGATIVLVTRVQADPTGAKGYDEITPLILAVLDAVCGWGPDSAPGVFTLSTGELVASQDGALIYQLDFALIDQLRITP